MNKDVVNILLICFVFTALSCLKLNHITIEHDESAVVIYSYDFIQNSQIAHPIVNITIFGQNIQISFLRSYLYTVPSIMLIPFLFLFGFNIFTLKLFSVLTGLLLLVVLYLLINTVLNRKFAFLTAFLLATSSSFLNNSWYTLRIHEPLIELFFYSGILFFLYFRNKSFMKALFVSFFLVGLCFSIKLSVIHRIIGLLVSLLVFSKFRLNKSLKNPKLVLISAAGFVIGSIFPIMYIFINGFTPIVSQVTQLVNNTGTNVIALIRLKFIQLFTYYFMGSTKSYYGALSNPISHIYSFLPVFNAVILIISLVIFIKLFRNEPDKKMKNTFIITLYFLFFTFTASFINPSPEHEYLISFVLPVFSLFLSYVVLNLYRLPGFKMMRKGINYIFLFPVVSINIFTTVVDYYDHRFEKPLDEVSHISYSLITPGLSDTKLHLFIKDYDIEKLTINDDYYKKNNIELHIHKYSDIENYITKLILSKNPKTIAKKSIYTIPAGAKIIRKISKYLSDHDCSFVVSGYLSDGHGFPKYGQFSIVKNSDLKYLIK